MTIHDCTLNGVSLSGLDKRICVLDVQEDAPENTCVTHALALGGQRLRTLLGTAPYAPRHRI